MCATQAPPWKNSKARSCRRTMLWMALICAGTDQTQGHGGRPICRGKAAMWENRISAHFETPFEQTPQAPLVGLPQQAPHNSSSCPNLVQKADLYQAARARAMLDHQLDKLFNPDGAAE
jgi:hypothetical protein